MLLGLQTSFLATLLFAIVFAQTPDKYEQNVIFRVWKNYPNPTEFISTFNTTLESEGCPKTGNFSIIIHGWLESMATTWFNATIMNLLKYSNGCVMLVDYNFFAKNGDYFGMVDNDFYPLAKLIGRKVVQIGNYSRIFMFGFSFGARLATEVGVVNTKGKIGRMDLCEPAGPGFDGSSRHRNFTLGAKKVACIHTSWDKGTGQYSQCPHSFRMGRCGWDQPAAGGYPMGSHGLCPHFYNSAFNYSFVPNGVSKIHDCPYTKLANMTTCRRARMGYLNSFVGAGCKGEYFINTATLPYYVPPPAGTKWAY